MSSANYHCVHNLFFAISRLISHSELNKSFFLFGILTMLSQKSESVKVLIRCRPFNQKEMLSHTIKCIEIQEFPAKKTPCVVKLISPKRYRRRISRLFRFDSIYDENQRTEHIFQDFVQSLVCDATLHGYSGTVFAYGQTGSGKSWTMTGCPCHSEIGLISNAIEHVFNLVHQHQSSLEEEFTIKCAYLESEVLIFVENLTYKKFLFSL